MIFWRWHILHAIFTERVNGALAVGEFKDTFRRQPRFVSVRGSLHCRANPFKPKQQRKHAEQEITVYKGCRVIA
jgi:hypothetical protein